MRLLQSPLGKCAALFFLLFTLSCNDNSKKTEATFKLLDEGLTSANKTISRASNQIYNVIASKLDLAATQYTATEYLPKAKAIQQHTAAIIAYMDSLKTELRKNSNTTATELFEKQDAGQQLYRKLQAYRGDVLNTDSFLRKEFSKRIVLTTPDYDTVKNPADFTQTFFNGLSAQAAVAVLSRFQNNVRIIENSTLTFLNLNISNNSFNYTVISPFISQSSNYVKAGEQMKISAGIFSFTNAAIPQIIINEKNIPLNDNHIADYFFKVTGKPGKHTIPVKIEYTDQNGKRQTLTTNVKYTVLKE